MADQIQLTCQAIGRYYKHLDAAYDGLFSKYCEDGDYDDDMIEDELNEPAEDSALVDFDDDFPYNKDFMTKSDAQKLQFKFDVINKCWQNPKGSYLHNVKMPEVDKDLFHVSQQELDDIKQIYQKQCPVLWNSGMANDRTFLKILAVGRKGNFDYLQHLVDDYFCARINNIQNKFDVADWAKEHKHFRVLKTFAGKTSANQSKKNMPTEPYDIAVSAVQSFGARCCPKLLLSPMAKIDDSLELCFKYIHAIVNFVSSLTDVRFKDRAVCPFQLDFCLATGKPVNVDNKVEINANSSSKASNDEDDTDEDCDGKEQSESGFVDCVGDVRAKLSKNKLEFCEWKFDADVDIEVRTRTFGEMFEAFVQKLGKKEDRNTYPHNRRFITFVDRREPNESDMTYMYEPPRNCRNIPNDVVPEWYINSSRTCLLPNMEYDEKKSEKSDVSTQNGATNAELKALNIGASCHVKGALLTLSFIVKESDAIKIYLYWNGQIIRVRPKDMKAVICNIYNMEWTSKDGKLSNEAFANGKEIEVLLREIESKVLDKYYQTFRSHFALK